MKKYIKENEINVPEPHIAKTEYLIGAHYFPGWKKGTHMGWDKIKPFPERKPLLGWYDEGNSDITDWEIKWCLEHGISYFIYCWYRTSYDGPVETMLSHAIHEGLFNAKYVSKFKFCIMWENENSKGVSSVDDLMENLFPYWMDNYFKHASYLIIDNKPILFVYSLDTLIQELGGVENTRIALDRMRNECVNNGFDGLTLLCEHRFENDEPLKNMAGAGFDYAFAYCWWLYNHPTPDEAIQKQLDVMMKWAELDIVPFVPTISMGWDPMPWNNLSKWHNCDEYSYNLTPEHFKTLCVKTKKLMEMMQEGSLARRLLCVDNWNEFGEGHYVSPTQQYGFGYLDAIREVFTDEPNNHTDIIPEDKG